MNLIVIDSSNRNIFSKILTDETVKQIRKEVASKINVSPKKIYLTHESRKLRNDTVLYTLTSDSCIVLCMKRKQTLLRQAFGSIQSIAHANIMQNITKALTLMLLCMNGNKVLAGLIFIIYSLISLSTYFKFQIDTSIGTNLEVAGKVVLCFFSSMFMIFGEDHFV